jgi:hypothetical protein
MSLCIPDRRDMIDNYRSYEGCEHVIQERRRNENDPPEEAPGYDMIG